MTPSALPSTPTPSPASAAQRSPVAAATPATPAVAPAAVSRALSYASAVSVDAETPLAPASSSGKRAKLGAASTSSSAAAADDDSDSSSMCRFVAPEDRPAPEPLTEDRVEKRSRQLAIGKATAGYRRYAAAVPVSARDPANPAHPGTPNPRKSASKRQWLGRVRKWRRALHRWDDGTPEGAEPLAKGAAAAAGASSSPASGPRQKRRGLRVRPRPSRPAAALPSLSQALSGTA